MIELSVNGIPYTDFTNASVTVSLVNLANSYSFTSSATDGPPPFVQGDSVEILVDGEKVLTGFIDSAEGVESEGSHSITYSGRDKTGDLIDSDIDVINELTPSSSLTLKRIIESTITNLGANIQVVDSVSPEPFNKAEDIVKPEVGQKAIDFIFSWALKRQVILTSDGEANILITQSQPVDSGASVQRLQQSDNNNILSQKFSFSTNGSFNRYIHKGQTSPKALNFAGKSDIKSTVNQNFISIDERIRSGRQMVIVESESYTTQQLTQRAQWSKQIARANAVKFSCEVAGHRNNAGNLWQVNTLVQINSFTANITRKMLLNQVTFSQGEGEVTKANLSFVEKDVYTLDETSRNQNPAGQQGGNYSVLGLI